VVPALSCPMEPDFLTMEPDAALRQYDALHLFVERVRALDADFLPTPQLMPTIAQICQRLDGMPLAIELAAARVNVLSVEQLAERLDDGFRLLTGGSRAALPRQHTLRATMDWSFDLLDDAERCLLRRLAVFAGSFSLEAIETICLAVGAEGELRLSKNALFGLNLLAGFWTRQNRT
jgi:predicted ATPase